MAPRRLASTFLLATFASYGLSIPRSIAQSDSSDSLALTEKAAQLFSDLEFEDAQKHIQKALRQGGLSAQNLAELYLLAGQIEATLGNEDSAVTNYEYALAIAPNLELPEGTSPKISAPMDQAKQKLGGQKIEVDPERISSELLILALKNLPGEDEFSAEATYSDSETPEAERQKITKTIDPGADEIEFDLPATAQNVKLRIFDLYRNQMIEELDVEDKVVEVAITKKTTKEAESSPSVFTDYRIYAGVSVAALLGGAFMGYQSKQFSDDAESVEPGSEFSRALALEDKAKSRALGANILFASSALFAGVSIWMYLRKDKSTDSNDKTSFAPILTSESVGLQSHWRF